MRTTAARPGRRPAPDRPATARRADPCGERRRPASRSRRSRATTTTVTVVIAVGLGLLPACSVGEEPAATPRTSATTPASTDPATPTPTAEAPAPPTRTVDGRRLRSRWPLTGLPVRGRTPRRPVVVVKVDNTPASVPQLGIGTAQLVVEELVEGGRTRLAAFYHRRVPAVVGPVRSLRGTDIPVVRGLDQPTVVASGGAPPTVRRFAAAGVRVRSQDARGFFRAAGRTAPYDLMVRLPELLRSVPSRRDTSEAFLPWGGTDVRGPRARRVTATFSGARSTVWEHRGGRYRPLNGFQASGDRFQPSTVLALRVPLGDAGYLDPAGNPVPETRLVGRGEAVLFHGGRARRATWVKRSPEDGLRLRARSGRVLRVPPGRTWVGLVPTTGGSVSWSADR